MTSLLCFRIGYFVIFRRNVSMWLKKKKKCLLIYGMSKNVFQCRFCFSSLGGERRIFFSRLRCKIICISEMKWTDESFVFVSCTLSVHDMKIKLKTNKRKAMTVKKLKESNFGSCHFLLLFCPWCLRLQTLSCFKGSNTCLALQSSQFLCFWSHDIWPHQFTIYPAFISSQSYALNEDSWFHQ